MDSDETPAKIMAQFPRAIAFLFMRLSEMKGPRRSPGDAEAASTWSRSHPQHHLDQTGHLGSFMAVVSCESPLVFVFVLDFFFLLVDQF